MLGTLRVTAWRIRRAIRDILNTLDRTPLYCRALAGESVYNVCVNSDLTISCNCQDFDGTGRIGDLRSQTFHEIFSGDTVRRFQQALAARKMPTSVCARCPEVAPIPKPARGVGPVPGRVPTKGIMVENTVLCNLRCGFCRRHELLALRSQNTLQLEDIALISTALAEHSVEQVCYFNLGEPFLSATILDEIRILRDLNPGIRIVTSTNGLALDSADKQEAALLMDYVYFSIAGICQETLEQYQVGGDFRRQYENMQALIRLRNLRAGAETRPPLVEWKYVYFRWNDSPHHIIRAIELAKDAGVDRISFHLGWVANPNDASRLFLSDPLFRSLGATRIQSGMSIDISPSEPGVWRPGESVIL